jgi:hypothetical protein
MSKGQGNSGERPPVNTGAKDKDGLPYNNGGYSAPLPKSAPRPSK